MCRSVSAPASAVRFKVRDLLGLKTEIIGVQASGAPAYARSFEEGRVVALNRAETHADGVAVRQPDPDAFAIIRAGASRIVTVSDDAIADCDQGLLDGHPQSGRGRRRRAARRAAAGASADGWENGSAWSSAAATSIWRCFASWVLT